MIKQTITTLLIGGLSLMAQAKELSSLQNHPLSRDAFAVGEKNTFIYKQKTDGTPINNNKPLSTQKNLATQKINLGTANGGGGNMVLVDGKWTLEDYFGKYVTDGESFRLSGAPLNAWYTLIRLLSAYSHYQIGDMYSALLGPMITDAEFRFVTKLPCNDNSKSSSEQYGCTKDGITYLIKDRFEKLSNEDRMFALLHERLHTFNLTENDHDWILPYVHTAKMIYGYLSRQLAGEELNLFPSELKQLQELMKTNDSLFNNFSKSSARMQDKVVLLKTGGIVSQFLKDENCHGVMEDSTAISYTASSFISVGSIFSMYSCNGQELRNSKLLLSDVVATDVHNSTILNSNLVNHINQALNGSSSVRNSRVENSTIIARIFTFDSNLRLSYNVKALNISDSSISDSYIAVDAYPRNKEPVLVNICNASFDHEHYATFKAYSKIAQECL